MATTPSTLLIVALTGLTAFAASCSSDEDAGGPRKPDGGAGNGGSGGSVASGGSPSGGSAGVSGASSGGAAGSAGGSAGAAGGGGTGCTSPALPPPEVGGVQVGGSNYVMWDVSAYLADPTQWYAPLALKPVIGTYDLAPDTVRSQLAEMVANGQKQIALMLWYMPLGASTDADGDGVWGHIVDSSAAKLRPQHEQNLVDLLSDIRCAGFNTLYFRFATQGTSDPGSWSAWDEPQFQQNWNFIYNTRELIDQQMQGKSVTVVYDLGVELGGITTGQTEAYAEKLWQNTNTVWGSTATYGFSFATAPGRLTEMLSVYDKTGVRPSLYAFDIYGDEQNTLAYVASELSQAGDLAKPILIQETYYDDAQANTGLRAGAQAQGLKLLSLFQWPIERGATTANFSLNYPAKYDAYLTP
jgi:hypothetical protein